MAHNKTLALLGLAAKAGKVSSGQFAAEKLLGAQKARLLLVAADASASTKKTFALKAQAADCPLLELADKEQLGHAIGKESRAVAAVTDEGLAKAIQKAAQAAAQGMEQISGEN